MQAIVIAEQKEVDYLQRCLKVPVQMIVWEISESVAQLDEFLCAQTDCVVVAVRNEQLRKEIIRWVTRLVPEEIIIDFFRICAATIPLRKTDKVLGNPGIPEFNGLILGISHAEVGLVSSIFEKPVANLAVSSQDIYYNYKTLKYAIENYSHKLQNVEYVIIDMFRYNYFNYDASKSGNTMNYYGWSGIFDDAHHFDEDKCRMLQEYLLRVRLQGITEEKLDLWEQLFGDVNQADDYKGYEAYPGLCYRMQIVNDEDVHKHDFGKSTVLKRFDATIEENKGYFKQLLLLIKNTWADARIIVLQMPLYELALKKSEGLFEAWKREFVCIIHEMQKVVDFEFLDYTNHEISKKKYYWHDFEHLNYAGAIAFTKEIEGLLKGDK